MCIVLGGEPSAGRRRYSSRQQAQYATGSLPYSVLFRYRTPFCRSKLLNIKTKEKVFCCKQERDGSSFWSDKKLMKQERKNCICVLHFELCFFLDPVKLKDWIKLTQREAQRIKCKQWRTFTFYQNKNLDGLNNYHMFKVEQPRSYSVWLVRSVISQQQDDFSCVPTVKTVTTVRIMSHEIAIVNYRFGIVTQDQDLDTHLQGAVKYIFMSKIIIVIPKHNIKAKLSRYTIKFLHTCWIHILIIYYFTQFKILLQLSF